MGRAQEGVFLAGTQVILMPHGPQTTLGERFVILIPDLLLSLFSFGRLGEAVAEVPAEVTGHMKWAWVRACKRGSGDCR